tara:strand:- start:317 stop:562 length:246 start_codon:yes stop_codon:yes gene_type:complete
MDSFTHLDYRIKPHFICVTNESGENGYFYSKGKFFFFSDDKLEDEYHVELMAESKQDFKLICVERNVTVPVLFWGKLKRMQ